MAFAASLLQIVVPRVGILVLALPILVIMVAALITLVAVAGRRVWPVLLAMLVFPLVLVLAVGAVWWLSRAKSRVVVHQTVAHQHEAEIAREIAELERRAAELMRLREKLKAMDDSALDQPVEHLAPDTVASGETRDVGQPTPVSRGPLPVAEEDSEAVEALSGPAGEAAALDRPENPATHGAPAADSPSPEGKDQQPSSGDTDTSVLKASDASAPRPAWVDSPPSREGPVHTIPLAIGPYSTLEECWQLAAQQVDKAVAQYNDWYLGPRGGADRKLVRTPAYRADWADPSQHYHEIRPSQLLGENMHILHVLLQFDDPYRQQLDTCWAQTTAAGRLTQVVLLSGAILALLATFYLYLKLDLATEGRYTRRLQCAVAGAILALVASGVLLARWTASL